MKKRLVRTLWAVILSVGLIITGCDSTAIQDEKAESLTATDVPTILDIPADEEAAARMSGEDVTASLERIVSKHRSFGGVVSVMTRNMYVGTDVDAIIAAAATGGDVPAAVAQAWAMLQQTDFPGRMKALAKEIARANPHLVGLQEVTTFRTQTPGDAAFGGTTPAEDIQMDFLATLLAELSSLGRSYRAVAQVQNIDVEMPLIHDPPDADFSTDIRLTDYDVILARSDVETSNTTEHNYAAYLPVPGVVDIYRGFVAVDATIRGDTYRFVSTHLEPVESDGGGLQEAQAGELLGILAGETRPLILVGDLNSDAHTGGVYNALVASGFQDVWDFSRRNAGYTCCQAPDLANRVSQLDRRIDLIFVTNLDLTVRQFGLPLTFSRVTGKYPWAKTASGLWDSDHAGVAAWMRVTRR